MKQKLYLLFTAFFYSFAALAQCPEGVAIKGITKPSGCTTTDGKFTITVKPSSTPAVYESGYVRAGNTDTLWFSHTSEDNNITNKSAGTYIVIVRNIATKAVCTKRDFVLSSNYAASFTNVSTPATACNIADGKIVLSGVSATDSVSWISSFAPVFTVVSSLSPANTIPNLKTGLYYIIIKSPNGTQCFATDTTLVGNTGVGANACPAPTLCTNAYGPNKFTNGTFGAGASLNGPALPTGETNYGYTQLAHYGPDDGFYAIARSTDYNGSGGKVFDTWVLTSDHTGDPNGYMMVVNASFDKDIVTEKTITGLCPNKTYQFSAYVKSLHTGIKPNLTFLIDGVGKYRTGDILTNDWVNIGFTFKSSGTSAKFSIRNNNPGGSGNDWVIDDILVGVCAPTIAMIPVNGSNCQNPATSLSATVTDVSHLYVKYKWQVNSGSGYVDAAGGAGTGTFVGDAYTATLVPTPSPITSLQHGWSYRLIVAEEDDDFADIDCRYVNATTLVVAQCGAVLPVKFNNVNAVFNNNAGKISWGVADQTNVKQYEVEKSIDGTNFSYLTTIANTSLNNYSAIDNALHDGVNYYRIKVINNDGRYSYSTIVTLALKGNVGSVRVFPNPVQDRLFVWMPDNTKAENIIIMDAVGKKIMQKAVVGNATNVADIDVRNLPKGVYRIQVTTDKNVTTNLSFIKK
ncbi:T9SS type A sorting domain-containing protein [Ferruginibacter sp. SUN002]|uniref:T9SS type A sorting domain-containing protein n=1 Tax=Ferruginibacter sp. SUN002 TaxID=2937789 RepID=UPI003D36E7F6